MFLTAAVRFIRNGGFLLAELMISLALTTLLLAALLPFVQISVKNYQLASAQITLEQQAVYALHLLTRDLRTADPASVMIGSYGDNITFNSHNYHITYERGMLPILYRDLNNAAGTQPVTDSQHSALTELKFSYHQNDPRIIDIGLTVTELNYGQSLTLITSVYLEN